MLRCMLILSGYKIKKKLRIYKVFIPSFVFFPYLCMGFVLFVFVIVIVYVIVIVIL